MAASTTLAEDLPPGIARPVQWKRLFENLKALNDGDPAKILDSAYAVGDSIGGLSDERQLRSCAYSGNSCGFSNSNPRSCWHHGIDIPEVASATHHSKRWETRERV